MSEVKRYDWHEDGMYPPKKEDGRYAGYYVLAADFDAAQSELAALREELEHQQCQVRSWKSGHEVLKQRLADAERRNAELSKAISDAEYRADQGKVWNGMGWTYTGLHSHGQQKVLDILRAALKPTESGASE